MKPDILKLRRSGNGPRLILLHGIVGSGAMWDKMIPLLSKHFEVWRLDLLGYGASPKPRTQYTPQRHVEAIRATLRHYGTEGPSYVAGLSMGASLALTYAASYPDEARAVVCLGLAFYENPAQARRGLKVNFWTSLVLRHPLLARLLMATVWRLVPHSNWLLARVAPKAYSRRQSRDSLRATFTSLSSSVKECLVNYRLRPVLAEVHRLGIPIRLVHGANDQWSPLSRIAKLLRPYPDYKLKVLDGCEHNLALVAPAESAAAIIEFFK